jgi:hypothetical protein
VADLLQLWEGRGLRENIIQLMKPTWFGFRKNWQVTMMMDKLLKIMALDRIRKNDVSLSSKSEENEEDEHDTDEALLRVNKLQKLTH